jgi:hypothetical protein
VGSLSREMNASNLHHQANAFDMFVVATREYIIGTSTILRNMRGDEVNSIQKHDTIHGTYISFVSSNSFTHACPSLAPTLQFHAFADLRQEGMGSMSTRNESILLNYVTTLHHTTREGNIPHTLLFTWGPMSPTQVLTLY